MVSAVEAVEQALTGVACHHKEARDRGVAVWWCVAVEAWRWWWGGAAGSGGGVVHDLFYRFIKFYTISFRYGSEVVSVRIGRRLEASNQVAPKAMLPGLQPQKLGSLACNPKRYSLEGRCARKRPKIDGRIRPGGKFGCPGSASSVAVLV